MLMGMSEVNAWLLRRRFKPGASEVNFDFFPRRLAYQLMYNPRLALENGEGISTRGPRVLAHTLVKNPPRQSAKQQRASRGACKMCGQRTQWSCICAPMKPGMGRVQFAKVVFCCSTSQNPECFASRNARMECGNRRSEGAKARWDAFDKARE